MQGNVQLVLISLFPLLLRWCVTYHSYSGQRNFPMFGDYEAQRHWQEITLNVPIEKWYTNTVDNDLQYWGLDYPPLTAYHSLVLGHVANKINSSYVKLYESRGFTSENHKYFMRLTVLCTDILTYIPSMICFVLMNQMSKNSDKEECNIFDFKREHIIIYMLLIYPGLILIDHGHFQYNCASLGLFIGAITAMLQNSFIMGSILFVAALNYKQMELYHALPIFFYILGKYLPVKRKCFLSCLGMLLFISVAVVLTFVIIWLPFLKNSETFMSVIFRLFPIARGVFEDKVANIWCAINVLYKLCNTFTNIQLAKLCLVMTIFAVLPSCMNLYLNPNKESFILSLINCALAFFLFSFQVHEKSILLAAIPVLLHFQKDPFPCFWFLIISHFSMLPLFIKDDLYLAYCTTSVFYFFSVSWGYPYIFSDNKLLHSTDSKQNTRIITNQRQLKMKLRSSKIKSIFVKIKNDTLYYCKNNFVTLKHNLHFYTLLIFYSSVIGIIILSVSSRFVKPPNEYPDLFPLLVSVYSCGHFIIFCLYFNYKQFCIPNNI